MAQVSMPRLSDSMEEGTILKWLKSEGEEVALGDPLIEVETDKADMVFEADAAGTLTEILVGEGEAAPVGAPIARLGGGEPRAPRTDRVRVSPIARRLAEEAGIELGALTGSGPNGRITKQDVQAALSAGSDGPAQQPPVQKPPSANGATAKGDVQRVELTKLQATVARRMAESKATIPHFYLQAEIDMSRCVEARARFKRAARDDGSVPSFNDLVVKACAAALRSFPRANGSYRDGGLELYARVNVGIAVAAEHALVVPTIFDADSKGLREIAEESRRLAERVRGGAITPPELAGGTFTVSNLGMYGVSNFSPVINPPQAAILAAGAIREVCGVPTMGVTLACDHRILYGAEAAKFLTAVRALLEEPAALAL